MRKVIWIAAAGLWAIWGCGNGSSGPGGGVGGTGGGGAAGGAGGGLPDDCNLPACMADLMLGCAPSGACTQQMGTGLSLAMCFDNGVKAIMSYDLAAGTSILVSQGGVTCYTMASVPSSGALLVKNAAGVSVGTVAKDGDGNNVVTCAGDSPVVLTSACDATVIGQASSGDPSVFACSDGTCVP